MKKTKNLIPIIIAGVLAVAGIIAAIIVFTGEKQTIQNGYTAEKGDTLNVVEPENNLAFDIDLEAVEHNFEFDLTQGVFQTKYGPYTKVDLKITNNSKEELDISNIGFSLVDENDKDLGVMYSYPAGVTGGSAANELTREKIASGETKSGSLYFANVEDIETLQHGKLEVKVYYTKKNPYSTEFYYMKLDNKVIK